MSLHARAEVEVDVGGWMDSESEFFDSGLLIRQSYTWETRWKPLLTAGWREGRRILAFKRRRSDPVRNLWYIPYENTAHTPGHWNAFLPQRQPAVFQPVM